MKKQAAFLALAIIAVFFAAGCRATPEQTSIETKESKAGHAAVSASAVAQSSILEEVWQDEMEIAGMRIVADAPVDVPKTSSYPVVRVRPTGFPREDVERILDYFAGDVALYENTISEPWMTRDVREQIIVEELRFQKDRGVLNDPTPEDVAERMDELFGPAPEESDAAQVAREHLSTMSESIYFDTGKTVPGRMILQDDREEANRAFLQITDVGFCGAYTSERHQDESAAGTGLSAEQAALIAETAADSMGFDYMDVSDVRVADRYSNLFPDAGEDSLQAYFVLFSRTYDGVKSPLIEIRAWKNSGVSGDSAEQYRAPWTPEYLELTVNETGVVALRWQNPVEVIGVENENTVIDFEEAKKDFAENMRLVLTGTDYLDAEEESGSGFMDSNEIHITRVVLGNEFFPVKDTQDEYQLMPCWIFFGYDSWLGDMSRELPTCEMLLDATTGAIV